MFYKLLLLLLTNCEKVIANCCSLDNGYIVYFVYLLIGLEYLSSTVLLDII